MDAHPGRDDELLTPLEARIIELVEELTAAIAGLCEDDDAALPLAEFDQRLLLEHAQVISRYVLAQAGARAFPGRYRLIGEGAPAGRHRDESEAHSDHNHDHHRGHEKHGDGDHDHDHDGHTHDDSNAHVHHVADPAAARAAHQRGRAIIGEHPWEQEHDHGDGHSHADEWEWEPIDEGEA